MLMTVSWAKKETITPESAEKDIQKIADYEDSILGTSIHVSAADVTKVLGGYFSFRQFQFFENAGKADIIREIEKGNIVIVPASGAGLLNPHFSDPLPLNHMLVIIGYDPATREFVTNDPGTKYGKNYRYDEDVLYRAMWDYPTGPADDPAAIRKDRKPMISVGRLP